MSFHISTLLLVGFLLNCLLNPGFANGLTDMNSSDPSSLSRSLGGMTENTESTTKSTPNNDSGIILWFHRINVIVFILSCLTSCATMLMIYAYLRNVSLVNQCLLLELYKDVVFILMLIRIVLIFKGFVSYTSLNNEVLKMSKTMAKITSVTRPDIIDVPMGKVTAQTYSLDDMAVFCLRLE